jgi:hypothetical protein
MFGPNPDLKMAPILLAALRRQLQRRVGPPLHFDIPVLSLLPFTK